MQEKTETTETTDGPTRPDDSKKADAGKPKTPAHKRAALRARFAWKKWLIIGAAAIAAVALVVMWMKPATVAVDTATVTRGPMFVSVDAQGRTRAKLRYTVGAPISGRLMRTILREGERISQGDVLARIAPPPTDARTAATARAELAAAQARQRQAEAARAEAASNLKLANSELVRRSDLYAKGFIGAEARETYVQGAQAAQSRLGVAQAALAAAAADVQSARSQMLGSGAGERDRLGKAVDAGAIEIRAPVDGLVLKVYEESERVLTAGSPLFDLSKGNELELIIDVLTQDATQVHPGDAMRITGWGGAATLAGKVRRVEPGAFTKVSTLGVEEQRVNVIGDLVDAAPALGAGYRIEVAIVTWTGDKVLRLPTGALFRRASAWNTFVVEGGRARLRALEVGHRNSEFAEVLSGLKEGDKVVLFPSASIADGVAVEATATAASATTAASAAR